MSPHRRLPALAIAALASASAFALAGCFADDQGESAGLEAIADCRFAPALEHVLYFGPRMTLQPEPAPAGSAPGNAFSSGFLTDDLKEWLSDPVAEGMWLVGDVTLEYWVRSTGSPAPLVIGGEPGEGYHFFNQFGSDRSLQPSYAVEYSDVAPQEGHIDHYTEILPMPPGGFVVERGDRVRVLLTDLALDSPSGGGHDVLFGGGTPSQVRFTARCWNDVTWALVDQQASTVSLPSNQGLLTGAVEPNPTNQANIPVTFGPDVERITLTIEQGGDRNPVKDDIDLVLLDSSGDAAWSIGSPYSNEAGALWLDNLQAVFPDGSFTVQVNSYSGVGYTGTLTVTMESARA